MPRREFVFSLKKLSGMSFQLVMFFAAGGGGPTEGDEVLPRGGGGNGACCCGGRPVYIPPGGAYEFGAWGGW